MSGSRTKLDKNNIITASIEELTEEERQKYLAAEEYFKSQFLKGFKKDRGGLVTRVEEFVMPTFKMSDNKVEVISIVSNLTPPSSTLDTASTAIPKSNDELVASLIDRIKKLEKGKTIVPGFTHTEIPQTKSHEEVLPSTSATTGTFPENPPYGMPTGYFSGQTLPPPGLGTPVKPTSGFGQAGSMVLVLKLLFHLLLYLGRLFLAVVLKLLIMFCHLQ
ncbi:unnamed protein product [Urochloa humidicola]